MLLTGEHWIILEDMDKLRAQMPWFALTGLMSFTLNMSSFFANKYTSALTLTVCGNIKQTLVIFLSFMIVDEDVLTAQKAFGVLIVIAGGCLYSYVGWKERTST